MAHRRWRNVLLVAATLAFGGSSTVAEAGSWQKVAKGILYRLQTPPGQRIHVVKVDLRSRHIGFRVTKRKHWRRTVSSFARAYEAKVAINGDFFGASATSGLSMADGHVDVPDSASQSYFAVGVGNRVEYQKNNQAVTANDKLPPWYRQAIGGRPVLLWDGQLGPKVDCASSFCRSRHPRTATGLTANRRFLFLVVVEGRQRGAAGMTTPELARHMKLLGAHWALNHDGGGSSTLWVDGRVKNRPSDGFERTVANHLAVTWQRPFCHGSLNVRLRDRRTGRGIPGAEVKVDGVKRGVTNATGRFKIARLRCGERLLRLNATGYRALGRRLLVDARAALGRSYQVRRLAPRQGATKAPVKRSRATKLPAPRGLAKKAPPPRRPGKKAPAQPPGKGRRR